MWGSVQYPSPISLTPLVNGQQAEGKKKQVFKRAERFVREQRALENDATRYRREVKGLDNIYVPTEATVVLVVRVRGSAGASPKVKRVFRRLRLQQLHHAVFVQLSAETVKMLRLVEPFVAYGNPNLKTVRELISKRGFGRLDEKRVPISDNSVVEAALGAKGVICVEDVVHEIYTVGPNFREVSAFLCPFKLSDPNGGFRRKHLNLNEGGDAGQRGEKINNLVKLML